MQVGDLVRYIATNEIGIVIDKEYECYQEETYRVYWFTDLDEEIVEWWDGSDLEALCK